MDEKVKLIDLVPQDQNFWILNNKNINRLTKNIRTEIVVIGGGVAGLSAAQSFAERGSKVVLLEKNFCGSGASGKSSGFITPDSELSLSTLIKMFGAVEAKKIWEFVISGINKIKNNIEKYKIDCDFQEQNTLVLATSSYKFNQMIKPEFISRKELGYNANLYEAYELSKIINSNKYSGAVSYGGSFGINGYKYCSRLKNILQEQGVDIFEETVVTEVSENLVKTTDAEIRADKIIVCTDYFINVLNLLKNKIYHAQTFLMISSVLSEEQAKNIFPGDKFMAWDTDLIYHYFRLSGDNRLLLGGSSLFYTYMAEKHNSKFMIRLLSNYFNQKFGIKDITFEYIWPGLIGISKDLFPIAGFDKKLSSVYYILAAAGLPWAAALGLHAPNHVLNKNSELEKYFSPYRKFPVDGFVQNLLGQKLSFAISNFLTTKSI